MVIVLEYFSLREMIGRSSLISGENNKDQLFLVYLTNFNSGRN